MIAIELNKISKSFGVDDILTDIKLDIKENDKVAIVGSNGSGKSTLLKIMAGEIPYDRGEIFKKKELTIGYLAQHTELESTKSIWEEMVTIFDSLTTKASELRKLEEEMVNADSLAKDHYEKLLSDYDTKQQAFEAQGGYEYEAEMKAVLTGLSFYEADYDTTIESLSGGQKTRLALAKLLLKNPQLLILDEPTNHLDITTMTWLENYLAQYSGAVVIVSHDRYFLDKTVSIIYEVLRHRVKKYTGSYQKYLEQKEKDDDIHLKEYEQQQTEIKKAEDFIQRNIVRASTTKRAQSKRKQLEKMEFIDKPLGKESSASFSFSTNKKSGKDVLQINELSFTYKENESPIFKDVTLSVHRGDRIALVGANGVGKSTLLKVLLQRLKQESGMINFGTNVEIGYYDQEQADLTSSHDVLGELWNEYPLVNEKDIRTVLGNFLFSGDDVLKLVHSLSGGEKARLALAKLMMQKANLLILDEPTNHLDIKSKEVLEGALRNFPGTIIFVSHDRYFINKIATTVAEMKTDGINLYLGNYDYYIEKKEEEREIQKLTESTKKQQNTIESERKQKFQQDKKAQSDARKKAREINRIEAEINELEEELAIIEEKMTLPEVFDSHEKALELSTEANKRKETIDHLMEEWTMLHSS